MQVWFPSSPSSAVSAASPPQTPADTFDAGPICLDDITYMPHLVEFGLEVVDLAEDVLEPSDLGVGSGDRIGCVPGLGGRSAGRLGC